MCGKSADREGVELVQVSMLLGQSELTLLF